MCAIGANLVLSLRTQQATARPSHPAQGASVVIPSGRSSRGAYVYDAKQRLVKLVPGTNHIIDGIPADADVIWYRNTGWQNGSKDELMAGRLKFRGGGQQFQTVLVNEDRQPFGAIADGVVCWSEDAVTNLATGAVRSGCGCTGPDPMQNVATDLSKGGVLVCTGGNASGERLPFSGDGNPHVMHRPATGVRDRPTIHSSLGRPVRQPMTADTQRSLST